MTDDDERKRRPASHTVGEALDDLSLVELDERLVLLRSEIARIEAAASAKRSAHESASSVFGRRSD